MSRDRRRRPTRGSRSSRSTRRRTPGTPSSSSPGEYPVHARPVRRRCTAAGSGRCASTPASAPPRSRTSATATCSRRAQTGLSVAFDLPTQMGYDSDHPRARGRGRPRRRRDRLARRHGATLFDGIPLDKVSTSMTINATASILLALYVAVAEEQGVPCATAARHDPERHPQGVHRARHVHLSAAPVDAASSPTCSRSARERVPQLEHDLDQRLPHPRGGLDGGAGGRVHARERHRLRRGGARGGPRRRRVRRRGSRSSSTPTTTSSRRSRSSARRGGCGRGSCASASARTDPRARMLRFHAQTGGLDADRAAAGQQHRARHDPGARRGARRRPVAPHERLRRGARAADRACGAGSRCARSRSCARGRAPRHRRSARRLLLRRGADRRARGAGAGAHRAHRRDGRRGGGDRAGLVQGEIQDAAFDVRASGRGGASG